MGTLKDNRFLTGKERLFGNDKAAEGGSETSHFLKNAVFAVSPKSCQALAGVILGLCC
jgi:hypothetical protein